MQANNKLRVFSGNSSTESGETYRRLADADLASSLVQNGAGFNSVADSSLYNSLSLAMSLPVVALVDFIAQYNSSLTFGQDLGIDSWISAVENAFASKVSVDNVVNGTTPVAKADTLTTARTITVSGNGTNSSASFDGSGDISLTIGTATNATYAQYASTDTSKGTIEERLTSLGFREGTITLESGISATTNYVKRQGNYVFGRLVFPNNQIAANPLRRHITGNGNYSIDIGTLPSGFTPKQNFVKCGVVAQVTSGSEGDSYSAGTLTCYAFINPRPNGNIGVSITATNFDLFYNPNFSMTITILEIEFGYEGDPITT